MRCKGTAFVLLLSWAQPSHIKREPRRRDMFFFIEAIVRAIEALMYPRRRKGDDDPPGGGEARSGMRASVTGCG
jgi:hypothetical protein